MEPCLFHRYRSGEYICSHCGASVCGHCAYPLTYESGEERTLCTQCAQRYYLDSLTEAIEVNQRLKRELQFMMLGFLFGCLLFASGMSLGILMPFVFGSLITIARKVYFFAKDAGFLTDMKNSAKEGSAGGFLIPLIILLLIIGIILILSPIIFIYRVVVRLKDLKKINQIIQKIHEDVAVLQGLIDNARAESVDGGVNVSALEGTGEDEAFNYAVSGMAQFSTSNTGEIIRRIDRR